MKGEREMEERSGWRAEKRHSDKCAMNRTCEVSNVTQGDTQYLNSAEVRRLSVSIWKGPRSPYKAEVARTGEIELIEGLGECDIWNRSCDEGMDRIGEYRKGKEDIG